MSGTFIFTAAEAYTRQAIAELRLLDSRIGRMRVLSPGVIRFDTSVERPEFLARLQAEEPIFVRHIHPVDTAVPVDGEQTDLEALVSAAEGLFQSLQPGTPVAVQVRRFGIELPYTRFAVKERIDPIIAALGGLAVTQGAEQVLSVSIGEGEAYLGLSTPSENLSDWPGGEVRFKREEDQLSRAKFKLLEAMQTFAIDVPIGGHALDLGAAPGGWTSLLLEKGLYVTAVDTAELGEALSDHPKLTFLRQNAQEATFPPGTFDLLTCDMSWNPLHTAAMVTRLAPAVRAGAPIILTVKLMLDNPTRTIRKVADALQGSYAVRKTKQLFHNRDEVTMHLARRAT